MWKQIFSTLCKKRVLGIIPHRCHYSNLFSDTVTCKTDLFSVAPKNPFNTSLNFSHRHYSVRPNSVPKTSSVTEAEYLVKLQDDPNVFGDAKDENLIDEISVEMDSDEEIRHVKPMRFQKLSTKQYADIIKDFLRKRKLKEAIDFVEIQMMKEDHVKPENYIFNLLLGACGRVGYTKKAFSLYNDMKRRGLQITPGTYTALFNACSNSPWPTTDGLTRAQHLRNIMIENMYEPNITNYNVMIKAFGRGGDLITAFALVDEMAAKRLIIKSDTLNFLLQACIGDKEAGFRHALLVWRKFMLKGVSPSVFSYNLMLRCIRDCGLGDIETTQDAIRNLLPTSEKVLMLEDLKTQERLSSGANIENSLVVNAPNLMAKVPHLGSILSFSEVTKPEHRLLLVGGCKQFLHNMTENDCKPDIKTFTQLLDNIPSTVSAENELIQDMTKNKIAADLDFYNMLIKKRSMRFDYEGAKDALRMIESAHMRPNLITYGVLAIGCQTKAEAVSLLQEMQQYNYRLSIEILGAMLQQACHHSNFQYVIHILELCQTQGIKPGEIFLDMLEKFRKKSKYISNDKSDPRSRSIKFQQEYKKFRIRCKTWLAEIEIDDSENVHPWQQYREESNTNTTHYRDKQEKTRFKPVHTSLFRQKTSTRNAKK